MTFQASNFKEKQFLNLLDNKHNIIEPLYIKRSLWIKYFEHSNSLCTKAIKAITNHTLIGKYCLRFFLRKDFSYLYRSYSIETRCHILYNCRRFNKIWNSMRNMLSQVISFLYFNPGTFSFYKGITQQSNFIPLLLFSYLIFFFLLFSFIFPCSLFLCIQL